MLFRRVLSLALSTLWLLGIGQLAFALPGGSSSSSVLGDEDGKGTKKRGRRISFLGCLHGDKEKEPVNPTSISSSSTTSAIKGVGIEEGQDPKNTLTSRAEKPYTFNPNSPPLTTDIQAYVRVWIPQFVNNSEAVSPRGGYKLLLSVAEIQPLYRAPKPEGKHNRKYIPMGEVLEGSMRFSNPDGEWKKHIQDHADFLYAAFVSEEYRDHTTDHSGGKNKQQKSGSLVKYVAFRREKGIITPILDHDQKNIQTFQVCYRERTDVPE